MPFQGPPSRGPPPCREPAEAEGRADGLSPVWPEGDVDALRPKEASVSQITADTIELYLTSA